MHHLRLLRTAVLSLTLALLCLSSTLACKSQPDLEPPKPDYTRPLQPGQRGLRQLDPMEWPDVTPVADQLGNPGFHEALNRSLRWFSYPSTPQYYPWEQAVSHAHAWASLYALKQLSTLPPQQRLAALHNDFDLWMSVGWDNDGTVLFTGYFSPIFQASRTRTPEFQYPLYQRPDDLVTDPVSGTVRGRRINAGGSTQTIAYPSRAEIEANPAALGLQGRELVWLRTELDAYIIHVNGSARLDMADGSTMYVGYHGNNGREYVSIGRLLVADGKLPADGVSLPAIRQYFRQHPGELRQYTHQNPRYVFFQPYDESSWPSGSLGFQVTDMRSLATDKAVFPRGAAVFVDTTLPNPNNPVGTRPFRQLMLDQDTGGAIRAPGRADIYLGKGDAAEQLAGRQAAEGRMYYLFLKFDRVDHWHAQMMQDEAGRRGR